MTTRTGSNFPCEPEMDEGEKLNEFANVCKETFAMPIQVFTDEMRYLYIKNVTLLLS